MNKSLSYSVLVHVVAVCPRLQAEARLRGADVRLDLVHQLPQQPQHRRKARAHKAVEDQTVDIDT